LQKTFLGKICYFKKTLYEQIMGMENAYLALDNQEYGFGNKIPLWLFGMLY